MPRKGLPPDPARAIRRAKLSALALMVPPVDWPDVLAGVKTEWRLYGPDLKPRETPCPVVLWTRHLTGMRTRMAVLVEYRHEPLGVIDADGLAREGFADLGEFRRYIEKRYPKGGYRPLAKARVYRVAPWDDDPKWGRWALEQVYGAWLAA